MSASKQDIPVVPKMLNHATTSGAGLAWKIGKRTTLLYPFRSTRMSILFFAIRLAASALLRPEMSWNRAPAIPARRRATAGLGASENRWTSTRLRLWWSISAHTGFIQLSRWKNDDT